MYLIPMANFRSLKWAFVIKDFGSLKGFREICGRARLTYEVSLTPSRANFVSLSARTTNPSPINLIEPNSSRF